MIKKDYQKPTVKVVQLRHRLILTSDGVQTLSGKASSISEPQETWYDLQ
jgi:hypothetical protein